MIISLCFELIPAFTSSCSGAGADRIMYLVSVLITWLEVRLMS